LAEIDVLLVPSFAQEATTRVILEAFAAGVPVIAFASGGIPEVVTHGVNGYLVRNAEEMAEALGRGKGLQQMADAARDVWAQRFTLERYKSEIAECMRAAAG
jgi:glycosyltransferase involved in cell wall biosynthesis